ncbi:classical arabinogalactan protein 5-like [Alnus glutinosa]|uniref:classical arabinogalactan protein 5-like n=1 Tax=Alnus glutinosa TaxID=3517 RepID=UPI002D78D12F|nr:classical arabinogalactan protein 5-like [Alnus glutinosa]
MAYSSFVGLMLVALVASSALAQGSGASPAASPKKSPTAAPPPAQTSSPTHSPTVSPPSSAPVLTSATPPAGAPTSSPSAPPTSSPLANNPFGSVPPTLISRPSAESPTSPSGNDAALNRVIAIGSEVSSSNFAKCFRRTRQILPS